MNPMKYSLRSLMIVVLVAPAAISMVAWLFLPPRDPAWWTWSSEKARLDHSIKEYLPDYEVEHVVEDEFHKDFYTRIDIRNRKDRSVIYSLKEGYSSTVF